MSRKKKDGGAGDCNDILKALKRLTYAVSIDLDDYPDRQLYGQVMEAVKLAKIAIRNK